jgi:hypothetical protein
MSRAMGKILLPSLFVLLLGLMLGAYAFSVFEIDGSTVKHSQTAPPSDGDKPAR